MNNRLKREDWLVHGLNVLRHKGHERLKAEPLARSLGVSRGSFYWHFPALQDFHAAILQAWRKQITEAVITELSALPDKREQLETLVSRALATPQNLEVAMRRWGGVNPAVANAIAEVDQIRARFLEDLFCAHGYPKDRARSRAAILTWAFIGRAFAPQFTDQLPASAATDLSAALLTLSDVANDDHLLEP